MVSPLTTRTRAGGAVLAATALVASLVGCAAAEPNNPDPGEQNLAVVFQPATESLAVVNQLYAFASEGFEQAGIDVTYNPVISNALQASQAVATGSADIGIVGSNGVLTAVGGGLDIVSVATITKGSTTQITLRNDVIETLGVTVDDPIEDRIEALKGLSLALPAPGSLTDLTVRQMFALYGIEPDREIVIRPLGDPSALVTATREGQVDGLAFSTPTSVQPVEEGYASVWVSLAEVPQFEELPFIDVITSRKFLQNNREAVKEFVRVLLEASESVEAEPASAGDAIKGVYFPDLSDGLWDLAWASSYPTATRGFMPTQEGLDVMLGVINDQTEQPVNVSFDAVYDLSILEELAAEEDAAS